MRYISRLESRVLLSAGDLDAQFGDGGIAGHIADNSSYQAIAVQRDGKILAAGFHNLAETLTRLNPDGSVDTGFGNAGTVTGVQFGFNDFFFFSAIAQKHNGAIYVGSDQTNEPGGGGHEGQLRQFDPDGTLRFVRDFDRPVNDLLRLNNDTLYVALPGEIRAFTSPLNFRLRPVRQFGSSGSAVLPSDAPVHLARQVENDTEFILCLSGSTLIRFTATLQQDNTFAPDHVNKFVPSTVTTDSQGRVILGGYQIQGARRRFAILRLEADGAIDDTFNHGQPFVEPFVVGTGVNSRVTGVVVRGDGKIIASGTIADDEFLRQHGDNYILVRLNDDGTPDTSFRSNGAEVLNLTKGENANDVPLAIALASDRDVLTAGIVNGTAAVVGFEADTVVPDIPAKTLYVRGTTASDTIDVSEDGARQLVVTIDGVSNPATNVLSAEGESETRVEVRSLGGNDRITLRGDDASYAVFAGSGNDFVQGAPTRNTIYGGGGNDTLIGGGSDTIQGDGFNTLSGDAGNDLLTGGPFSDSLLGGAGDDTLNGGSGPDWLRGGKGSDVMNGGPDHDRFYNLDSFPDTLDGGAGVDQYQTDPLDTVKNFEETFMP